MLYQTQWLWNIPKGGTRVRTICNSTLQLERYESTCLRGKKKEVDYRQKLFIFDRGNCNIRGHIVPKEKRAGRDRKEESLPFLEQFIRQKYLTSAEN